MWYHLLSILISLYSCRLLTVNAKLPLLFPPTSPTRTQLIVGIGIPLGDLTVESLITGYVLKAEYFLPSTVEQLKEHSTLPINGRHLRGVPVNLTTIPDQASRELQFGFLNEYSNSSSRTQRMLRQLNHQLLPINSPTHRWTIYRSLVLFGDRMNLNGRQCLLKSICEAAQTPLHSLNGLFTELFYILLTPSASFDVLSKAGDYDYIQAELYGRADYDCNRLYSKCPRSLLDHFTSLHHMLDDMLSIFN